jgi:polyphosphate kinase
VRSVIGRFLEHSRVFVFGNGGNAEVYLGSADWMHRNIYERVEVMFHLKNEELRDRILREVIAPYMADNEKARVLMHDGKYLPAREAHKNSRNGFRFNVQEFLLEFAQAAVPPPLPPVPFLKTQPASAKSTETPRGK